MLGDPQSLTGEGLELAVREVIAEVLVVPLADVKPQSHLVEDLGAESIDFLDLVFRLEDRLGDAITQPRWEAYLARHLTSDGIHTTFIVAFAAESLARKEDR